MPQESNDRIRERLLELIGKLGREANAIKSTQAILQLLWEVSRLADLPKNLVERALGEQLDILTSMTVNRDAMKKVLCWMRAGNMNFQSKKNPNFPDLRDEMRGRHKELFDVRPGIGAPPPLPLQELLQDLLLQGRRQGHARRAEQAARDRQAPHDIAHKGEGIIASFSQQWDTCSFFKVFVLHNGLMYDYLFQVPCVGRQAVWGRGGRPHRDLRV